MRYVPCHMSYNCNFLYVVNGITAKTFATDITEEDIKSAALGFSFGGKKVLQRVLINIKSKGT